ncbi:radical SAM protein [Bacteroides thetaiotaomicron]|uniref:radical SAM protein n=1 Tax=Bacteroides thetaiotaomicron TaxID=818 RepID=UPI0039C3A840
MLILITKKCFEACPHCMEDASPDGKEMDMATFIQTLNYAREIGARTLCLSGGEITTHPLWYEMAEKACDFAKKNGMCVILESNGTFITNPSIVEKLKSIMQNERILFMQIVSTKRLYKSYEQVWGRAKEIKAISPKIHMFDTIPGPIKPLGRAKGNPLFSKEIEDSKTAPSCINSALVVRQTRSMKEMILALEIRGMICKPMIDVKGDVFMSECALCPSVGNISEGAFILYQRMKEFLPCNACEQCKNVAKSILKLLFRE